MFDLDREIERWCTEAAINGPPGLADELADHLSCAIDARVIEGMSAERAFQTATRQLGDQTMINAELTKNRGIIARICAFDRRLSGIPDDPLLHRAARRLLIGNSLLWGAAQLATALIVGKVDQINVLTVGIFIPLWFASMLIATSALRSLRPSDKLSSGR